MERGLAPTASGGVCATVRPPTRRGYTRFADCATMSAMATKEPSFTLGIEEEYLLVDKDTRDLAQEPPAELLAKCEEALRGQVSPEFLRSQIEVGTRVCKSMQEARDQLIHLRSTVGRIAGEFGLAPIAASTHPFA